MRRAAPSHAAASAVVPAQAPYTTRITWDDKSPATDLYGIDLGDTAQHARVLAADISGQQEDTVATLGSAAVACHVDVSKESDVEATIALAVSSFGRLDIIFNNVGVPTPRPGLIFEDHTNDDFDRLFAKAARAAKAA